MTFKDPEDEEFDRIEKEQAQRYANMTLTAPKSQTVFYQAITPNPKPILTITADGDVLWKERKIESDKEFKKAMLDLKEHFDITNMRYRRTTRRLNNEEVLLVWQTLYPSGATIDSDTFIYDFANALQTYLGIGE
jgi:hypothetical protein